MRPYISVVLSHQICGTAVHTAFPYLGGLLPCTRGLACCPSGVPRGLPPLPTAPWRGDAAPAPWAYCFAHRLALPFPSVVSSWWVGMRAVHLHHLCVSFGAWQDPHRMKLPSPNDQNQSKPRTAPRLSTAVSGTTTGPSCLCPLQLRDFERGRGHRSPG